MYQLPERSGARRADAARAQSSPARSHGGTGADAHEAKATGAATFFAAGVPQPQGSKTGIVIGGRAVLIEGRNNKARRAFREWREAVRHAAEVYVQANNWEIIPKPVPVSVHLTFSLPRPAGHWNRSRKMSAVGRRMPLPSVKPDCDKLARSVLDSCSDVLYADDSQVCSMSVLNVYESEFAPVGVWIMCGRMAPGGAR